MTRGAPATRYLTAGQVVELAGLVLGAAPRLRDPGLLESAVHRPQASMFGHEAYGDVMVKAAALLQSLAVHRPFATGGAKTAWICTVVFLAYNGVELDTGDDAAHDLVTAVARGRYAELDEIARVLRSFTALV
ncbi:Fic family protein [Sphaerisporangium sp. TRM90804]|uniref:type II toxin-antitoxin system death-on-curing family toxin n=1 Tax=Sphaerisporangium sp. TRM90804 TaxID=3031113 RepID=UPI00244AF612|nr:Fic family protein [Sphaerisporangium sp. TRM90804]MDH2424164.1 type II toxin-antitoxin system death-on-curing family toxin [Sphaerisporangium sp. TRM90804]